MQCGWAGGQSGSEETEEIQIRTTQKKRLDRKYISNALGKTNIQDTKNVKI